MRALVTGANGFVGRYLVRALREAGHDVLEASGPEGGGDYTIDLADPRSVHNALEQAHPELLFHLAAQAFVPASLADPIGTYRTNIIGTAYVLEALRGLPARAKAPRVLIVSSAEVYGKRPPADFPLSESLALRPATPYAASKAACEAIALASFASFGTDAVVTRAFNHIGPGQDEQFVVPSFAGQLAKIAAGAPPELSVGNLQAERDFLDVRDVVAAYIALAEHGAAGEIYNVCRGEATSIQTVLRELITIAHVPVRVQEDPSRMRAADVPRSYGSSEKLRAATGWSPRYSLRESLRDIYAAAQQKHGETLHA